PPLPRPRGRRRPARFGGACVARRGRGGRRLRARGRSGRGWGAERSCVLLEGQGGEAPERTRDAQPRGRGTETQAGRDVVVGQLAHDAELERLALVCRQRLEGLLERGRRREPVLDGCIAVLWSEVCREPEPAARP